MSKLVLSVGELLWDVLPDRTVLGGAPSNVAFRLVELGSDGRIVSRVGTDELGRKALKKVAELGLSTHLIQQDPRHPTGTVDVTFDALRNPDYVINPDVAYDYIASTPGLIQSARECHCLVYGTLAQRGSVTRETLAVLMEQAHGAIRFLDINLRKECYTPERVEESLRGAHVLKANHHELWEIRKMTGLSANEIPGLTGEISDKFDIPTIVVTLEQFGAFLFDRKEGMHYLPGHEIPLEDPLGAGDAFSAVLVHFMLEGKSQVEACMEGNRRGAAVATTPGATQRLDEEYIEKVTGSGRFHFKEDLAQYVQHPGS